MSRPEERSEDEQERLNRQLGELLQELRIAMPGVQLLFGFLLAVPFNQRFADVSAFQKDVYIVALLTSAIASALFIAPTAYHRIMFEQGDKARMVRDFSRAVVVGLAFLALAMASAVLLVTAFLFGDLLASFVTGTVLLLFGGLWFALPTRRRVLLRREREANSRA